MSPHSIWSLAAALVAIAVLIFLIAKQKLHPFVALITTSIGLGLVLGMPAIDVVRSFEAGVGNTLGHVAVVIALGTILGKLMAESGGADQIAETVIRVFGLPRVHWAMLLIGMVTGLPVFFEVGFVLLIPIAFTVAKRAQCSLVLVALPMLAGLSVVHAFIPPHPAALAAVVIYHADVGMTITYALLIGIPAAILAGPLYAKFISPRIVLPEHNPIAQEFSTKDVRGSRPGFFTTLATILLPVLLMLMGGWADRFTRAGTRLNSAIHLFGTPAMALLIGVLVGLVTFGWMQGFTREKTLRFSSESLPPTAGAILLIGAGGGFGRILQESSIAGAIVEFAQHAHLPVLLMAWLMAALIRVATGSSTVAMTTAAGLVAPIALHSPNTNTSLLVIATGAGSIVFSHVNDGGFWLVKEYLDMSVPQTFKTWSACETILSVAGLAFVILVSLVV